MNTQPSDLESDALPLRHEVTTRYRSIVVTETTHAFIEKINIDMRMSTLLIAIDDVQQKGFVAKFY